MFYFEKWLDSLRYIRLWLTIYLLYLENITVFTTVISCSFVEFKILYDIKPAHGAKKVRNRWIKRKCRASPREEHLYFYYIAHAQVFLKCFHWWNCHRSFYKLKSGITKRHHPHTMTTWNTQKSFFFNYSDKWKSAPAKRSQRSGLHYRSCKRARLFFCCWGLSGENCNPFRITAKNCLE